MKKLYVLFLIIIQCYLCLACTCIGKKSVNEEFSKADVVFVGKILSRNNFLVEDSSLPIGYKMYKVRYKVLNVTLFKGNVKQDTIQIITGLGGGDCGVEFKIGCDYIIYSFFENKYFPQGKTVNKYLYTDICKRTRLSTDIEEIKVLNKKCKKTKTTH